jgi:cyclopropane fatty-acyl-phospholipid synthase-like methyltransferase
MTAGSVFDDAASTKLEAAYQTPDVIAQRQQTLRALALQPSERVLDIGAGPGLLVAEMAQSVGPSGHVTGLVATGHSADHAAAGGVAGGTGWSVIRCWRWWSGGWCCWWCWGCWR